MIFFFQIKTTKFHFFENSKSDLPIKLAFQYSHVKKCFENNFVIELQFNSSPHFLLNSSSELYVYTYYSQKYKRTARLRLDWVMKPAADIK